MALGIRGANPIWVLVNLAGKLFDDTYYMYVLENILPYVPATVFHDPDLSVEWTGPIQFLANGTLPDDVFFESDKVYRLEFRQNPNIFLPPSQSDPLIYEINDYVAGTGGTTPVDSLAFATDNQITNPQFALINFSSPFSLINATNPNPIEIGPGWFLELSGTGNVTISQVPLNVSDANPSNAPYSLRLQLSGWVQNGIILRQRFQQNGMLWANKTVSGSITARINGAPQGINSQLIDSNSVLLGSVLTIPAVNSAWNEYTGHAELPATQNNTLPPAAYIEYRIFLPNNVDINLSSIQLVVQDLPLEPKFEQDSIERQIDHTFHYYKQPLMYKPIPSYLIGWDFPLNPAQMIPYPSTGRSLGQQNLGANTSYYAWDQTILFQQVNNSLTISDNPTLTITPSSTTQFALIQYLSGAIMTDLLLEAQLNQLSSNIRASSMVSQKLTISLWWTSNANLPSLLANQSLVFGLDANGHPNSVAGGWNEILRINQQQATAITQAGTTLDYGFSGWMDLNARSTATFFAIVVGTDSVTAGNNIDFKSISLVPGSIPTIPAPQTRSEVLRECENFFEKSWAPQVPIGTLTAVDSRTFYQFATELNSSTNFMFQESFNIAWKQSKRAVPIFVPYSTITLNTPFRVTANYVGFSSVGPTTYGNSGDVNNAVFWVQNNIGSQGANYTPIAAALNAACFSLSTPNGVTSASAWLSFHYTVDARLGIVN